MAGRPFPVVQTPGRDSKGKDIRFPVNTTLRLKGEQFPVTIPSGSRVSDWIQVSEDSPWAKQFQTFCIDDATRLAAEIITAQMAIGGRPTDSVTDPNANQIGGNVLSATLKSVGNLPVPIVADWFRLVSAAAVGADRTFLLVFVQ